MVGLRHMNEVATELMKDVLDAYAQRDADRAREVWERDVDLDALEDSVFRNLLTHMMEDPRNISFCAHLLLLQEHRADRRPRHQHRRDGGVSGHRPADAVRAPARPAGNRHRRRSRRGRRVNQVRRENVRANGTSATRILVVEDNPISRCCSGTISKPKAMSSKRRAGRRG